MSYTLHLDIETYSATPIKQGTHRYAEDAEVIILQVAFDDAPVEVYDLTYTKEPLRKLQRWVDGSAKIVIHNSSFERTVLRRHGVNIPVEKIEDTMVLALQHGLPGGLDQLCDILGVPKDKAKDKAGKKLIQLFCKPRPKNVKLRRATKETHPDEWERFLEYARLDVDAMRDVYARLPRFNCSDSERDLWRLDQVINDAGFAVDIEHARSALRAFDGASRSLGHAAASLTGGALNSTTQRDALIAYLKRELDFDVENLQKGTVEKLLTGEVPDEVRKLLENRQEAAATSPSKYRALLGAVSSDGRLRGTIQFCGASRTGRDAGRIFQPQNLPRTPDWFDAEAQEATVRAFKAGLEDLLFDDIVDRCSFAIRGCLIPERGNKLLVSDLSNIEGRTLAWLAGEQWKIEAFKAYDRGEGHDLYKVTAGRILGKDPGDVVKIERQNQGKVPELAGGYQGGVGAYRKMGGPVFNAMTDDEIMEIVVAWRAAHPRTKSLWYEMEAAAKAAINKPGESFEVRGLIRFDVVTDRFGIDWLRMRLPSGRYLVYCRPKLNIEECHRCEGSGKVLFLHNDREMQMVCPECNGGGRIGSGQVSYEGVNQYTRQWTRLDTYGGKLCIAGGTLVLTDAGWLPIEHVSTLHKLWDGVEWVTNEGLVRKGIKEVINLNGVWMTPDHEVLATEGWVSASQSEGLERADPRLPHGCEVPRQRWSPVTVVAPLPMRRGNSPACIRDNETTEARRTGLVRLYEESDYSGEEPNSRDVKAQSLCGLAQHARPLHVTDAPIMAQLRRAWRHGLRGMAALFSGLLGGHGVDVPRGPDVGTAGQFRRVQPDELRMGHPAKTGAEQEKQHDYRHAMGPNDSGRSSGSCGSEPEHIVLPREQRSAGSSAVRGTRYVTEVYDLVNCGPRRRFVVAGETGEAFIVHNCENAVQAIARDVFFSGLKRAMAAGYSVVLRVHDELVCEVPLDDATKTADGLSALMATNDSWNVGLPLAAAGDELMRYGKT